MDSWKVALIDQTGVVPVASLQQFAAALQQQTDDDLAPAWNVRADISVLSAHENIPAGTWPRRSRGCPPAASNCSLCSLPTLRCPTPR